MATICSAQYEPIRLGHPDAPSIDQGPPSRWIARADDPPKPAPTPTPVEANVVITTPSTPPLVFFADQSTTKSAVKWRVKKPGNAVWKAFPGPTDKNGTTTGGCLVIYDPVPGQEYTVSQTAYGDDPAIDSDSVSVTVPNPVSPPPQPPPNVVPVVPPINPSPVTPVVPVVPAVTPFTGTLHAILAWDSDIDEPSTTPLRIGWNGPKVLGAMTCSWEVYTAKQLAAKWPALAKAGTAPVVFFTDDQLNVKGTLPVVGGMTSANVVAKVQSIRAGN